MIKNKVESFNYYLLIIFLFYCFTSYFYWDFVYDDTYIYAKYIKNLSNGNGFCFNIGEISYGCTSLLWAFIGTLFTKIFGDPLLVIKWLSYISRLFSILIFYKLSLYLIKDKIYSSLATFSLCITPWFLRDVASGLETNTAIFMILLGCYVRLREKENNKTGYFSIVLFAFSFLIRPECILLLFIYFIDVLFIDRSKGFFKQFFKLALTAIAVILPFQIYAFLTFGSIVPGTIVAKTVVLMSFLKTFKNFITILGSSNGLDILIFFVMIILSIKKEYRIKNYIRREELFLFIWMISLILTYLFTRTEVRWRYLAIISPLITIFAFGALKHIGGLIKMWFGKYTQMIVLIIVILLIIQSIAIQFVTMRQLFLQKDFVDLAFIGKWINTNTPKDSIIAVHEIGAIGYYCNRRIIDTAGLVTPEIIPFMKGENGKTVFNYLHLKKANYFVDIKYNFFKFKTPEKSNRYLRLIYSKELMTTGGRTLSKPSMSYIYEFNWDNLS